MSRRSRTTRSTERPLPGLPGLVLKGQVKQRDPDSLSEVCWSLCDATTNRASLTFQVAHLNEKSLPALFQHTELLAEQLLTTTTAVKNQSIDLVNLTVCRLATEELIGKQALTGIDLYYALEAFKLWNADWAMDTLIEFSKTYWGRTLGAAEGEPVKNALPMLRGAHYLNFLAEFVDLLACDDPQATMETRGLFSHPLPLAKAFSSSSWKLLKDEALMHSFHNLCYSIYSRDAVPHLRTLTRQELLAITTVNWDELAFEAIAEFTPKLTPTFSSLPRSSYDLGARGFLSAESLVSVLMRFRGEKLTLSESKLLTQGAAYRTVQKRALSSPLPWCTAEFWAVWRVFDSRPRSEALRIYLELAERRVELKHFLSYTDEVVTSKDKPLPIDWWLALQGVT